MRYGRSIAFATILGTALLGSGMAAHAFSMDEADSGTSEIYNKKFQRAALLEARAYVCGSDSTASEAAMRAGMQETGLPEDIAVEVVSDLASGIIDKAVKNGNRKLCGKAEVRLSKL
ncbi:hypothetical protein [Phyllobacterium sp. 21LDTY02-6]|uniref:hypothetical protein n=1 Tax=Phyllobacterium sp. 21LDTY02-6 TaxID=2944903 RepID=UPI00208E1C9A|nr:hypothetical protein [Phyllobacterium sp. 21LDTY02-6]